MLPGHLSPGRPLLLPGLGWRLHLPSRRVQVVMPSLSEELLLGSQLFLTPSSPQQVTWIPLLPKMVHATGHTVTHALHHINRAWLFCFLQGGPVFWMNPVGGDTQIGPS